MSSFYQKIHTTLFRAFTGYGYAVAIVLLIGVSAVFYITSETNSSGIVVSEDRSELTCAADIHIYTAENAADFLEHLSDYEDMTFQRMICTVNNVYDGSADDKQAVQLFIKRKLSFWPVRRKDIETYFRNKIGNASTYNYFLTLSEEEKSAGLADFGAKDCAEFKEKYFHSNVDYAEAYQAMAYDMGICIPQDLHRARAMYEDLYQNDPDDIGPFALRLGLIYQYGPEGIRDLDKARFFYKQGILYFAHLPIENSSDIRRQTTHGLINNLLPLPEMVESELLWLEDVLKKPTEERKRISEELEKEGYDAMGLYLTTIETEPE